MFWHRTGDKPLPEPMVTLKWTFRKEVKVWWDLNKDTKVFSLFSNFTDVCFFVTWRNNYVIIASKRRRGVVLTQRWRYSCVVCPLGWCHYGPSSCKIRKVAGCACAANVFPATAGKRSRHAPRHVRHARAMMHTGIATVGVSFEVGSRGHVPDIPGACATRNFTYLVRGQCHIEWCVKLWFISIWFQ